MQYGSCAKYAHVINVLLLFFLYASVELQSQSLITSMQLYYEFN